MMNFQVKLRGADGKWEKASVKVEAETPKEAAEKRVERSLKESGPNSDARASVHFVVSGKTVSAIFYDVSEGWTGVRPR
jgi:hypothetical protein